MKKFLSFLAGILFIAGVYAGIQTNIGYFGQHIELAPVLEQIIPGTGSVNLYYKAPYLYKSQNTSGAANPTLEERIKGVITYSGIVNANTYTEIFVNGVSGSRVNMPLNSVAHVTAIIVAYSSINGEGSSQEEWATFRRNGTGDSDEVGETQVYQKREDNLFDVLFDIDNVTDTIILQVKASAGSNTLVNGELSYTFVTQS